MEGVGIVSVGDKLVGDFLCFPTGTAEYDSVYIWVIVGDSFECRIFVFGMYHVVHVSYVFGSFVSTVIMDEADEMLNMGFLDSINTILSKVPQERKMLLFSATMPKEIEQIARTYMHEPKEVVVGSRNEGAFRRLRP